MEIFTFDSIITFGKYKDVPIKEVYEIDASYLKWALETISWFKMSEKDIKIIEEKAEDEHLDWLHDNEIKYDPEDYD